jgi:hypothetical protein
MKRLFHGYIVVLLSILPLAGLFAQQKYALVIGNGKYVNITKLNNPENDANDMETVLRGLGFTVEKVLNGSLPQMETGIVNLKNKLKSSKNSYGFFFYAGHGVQSNGENYLIPVDANIQSESFLRRQSISVQEMLDELNDAGNELNVVVLDACRDNPFPWKRSGSRGLQMIGNQPADSIIVYATSAGSTAADGTGRNGLFTSHLLNNLKQPGLEVAEVFRRTGSDVSRASNRTQIPAIYNQFFETAYLGQRPTPNAQVQPAQSVQSQTTTPTPAPNTPPPQGQAPQPEPAPSFGRNGIYIGIITFGPDAEDITGGNPVYLDQQGEGMARLNRLLETRYQRGTRAGTALFYSAHLALANMKLAESKIPKRDLANVTLFTFTDGLDVSSTSLSLPAINDPGNASRLEFAGGPIRSYMDFVKGEIDNRKINGTFITARVVAVQSDDIVDVTAFRSALRSLATGERYVRDAINMARLNEVFNEVFQETANGIVNAWTQSSFTMVTPEYAAGTRVRMVFGSENAQNARFYIDGEVTVQNRQYYISNISYGGGINSNIPQGGEIRGIMGKNSISYNFPQFTGFNLDNAVVTQWLITNGNNRWLINSEYNSAGTSQQNVYVERHNALIYLVLDRSSSIAPADFPKVQQAAKDFIKHLQNVYW